MFYLSDAAIILLLAVVLVAVSWCSGHPNRSLLENTAIGVGAMLGAAGTCLALISYLFSVSLAVWAACLVPVGFLFLPHGRPLSQRIPALSAAGRAMFTGLRDLSVGSKCLLLYLVGTFVLTLSLTLAPPGGNDYDSLVYHLAAPQRYVQAHKIIELPYDHHSYFPFLTEMLFALGLAWKGAVLAKLFHWLMLPLGALTLWAIGRKHFSHNVGLLAAALYATIPLVQIEATTAYVDLSLVAFVLLAFLAYINWLQSEENSWAIWAGVFCGFALGTKYSGVLFIIWLVAWAVGRLVRSGCEARFPTIKSLAGLVLWSFLLGGGWLLRNVLWTGNPVFPFAYEIFGGRGWTLEMAKAYTADQATFGFGHSPLDLLLLPFRLAWAPLNFGQPYWPFSPESLPPNGPAGRFEVAAQIVQSFIGPPLIAFVVPLVVIRRKPAVIGFLLWTALAMGLFWAATSQQIRYILPTLALLCVCAAWGIERFSRRTAILKYSCWLTLAAWLVFVPAHSVHRLGYVWPVVSGQEKPEDFLGRSAPGYAAMQWANEDANTRPDAVFAVYGEPRDFYLRRSYFWADDQHNNLVDYSRVNSGADLARALKTAGATHVLVNLHPEQNGGFGGPPAQFAEGVEKGNFKRLFGENGYEVYSIS